ncbi:RNA-directed DNA polymerase, eukaryota [Tanacetum coccineum]
MGFRFQNSLQSKIDQTSKISKSVFISNFPDDCSSRDLWKVCNGYGTVVDVFIPNKRSKAGKRFAFVRFINVLNLDRLIENLKTIWIGRFHLSANPARFERPKASTFQKEKSVPSGNITGFKQSIVQNQGGPKESYSSILKPSLVLDDSCLVLLSNEGFHNTRVVYLGGLWVMIELKSSKSKSKFMEHVGVASWFRRLCYSQSDFAAKERIVWVDIEGVPLNAWPRSTFQKISSKWGELVELEDGYDDLFVFWARAKELFVWSPSFKDVPKKELFSDDESAKINEQANNLNNDEVENASEVVSDTYFGAWDTNFFKKDHHTISDNFIAFIPYPSGFTPANDIPACNNQDIPEAESDRPPSRSARSNSRVLEEAENSVDRVSSESFSNGVKIKEGAFPLISAICLDRHLSDHRPILLKEVFSDFGPTPFRFYHSWLELPGFDDLVSKFWNSFTLDDSNGGVTDDILLSRLEVLKQLHDVQSSNNRDIMQKAKIRWAIEGDENSKYFHAIINKKRANLSVKGIMVDGDWIVEPDLVKQEFRRHFTDRFQDPGTRRGSLNFPFPNRLNNDQILELESPISNEDIRTALIFSDLISDVQTAYLPNFTDSRAGIFKGYKIDPSTTLSHLFYADDAKSHLLGVGIPDNCVAEAAKSIGCLIMKAPFKYLVFLVGDNMSSKKAWDETINKMKRCLSR